MIPDFGERIGADGLPVDEFADVLVRLPPELGTDGVMLAGVIARHRCTGCGGIEAALQQWEPESAAQ